MATRQLFSYISRFWPNNKDLNEIEIDFLKKFAVKKHPLNGLMFHGLYIPEEVMMTIFSGLSPSEILKCALVCKNWFNIAKSNALWRMIYNRKERPKKAKNLPWYVYYCYFTTDNFNNLIKNGNGEEGFNHWEVVLYCNDNFAVEEPTGCDPLPLGISEFHGHTTCFVTPYEGNYQKIDLMPKRLLRHIIRKYKPVLYASEWYTGRSECGSTYELTIICIKKKEQLQQVDWNALLPNNFMMRLRANLLLDPPYIKNDQGIVEQGAHKPWEKLEILCEDYPEDTKLVLFGHTGKDIQCHTGLRGSKIAGGVLKFMFDSINPTLEDVDDSD